MPELELNPDTVCFLIDKAREFHAKEEVVIPDTPGSPTEDWALQVLADHADDATYQEFCATVNDLEPISSTSWWHCCGSDVATTALLDGTRRSPRRAAAGRSARPTI